MIGTKGNKRAFRAVSLGVVAAIWIGALAGGYGGPGGTEAAAESVVTVDGAAKQGASPAPQGEPGTDLPQDRNFQTVAESDTLILKLDRSSGHFQVADKRNGHVWRSYPNPEQWHLEQIAGGWRAHLRSPLIVEYTDLSDFTSKTAFSSLLHDGGAVEDVQITDTGFRLTFHLTGLQMKIPVEVSVRDDYVETTIDDAGVVEEGPNSLLNVKLYPMFGSEPSVGQDGYLFVPDGSGALISFREDRKNETYVYRESVYGSDLSFFAEQTGREGVNMPVFGLKSDDRAFLAVIHRGAEYAQIYASPSGSYGSSNWIAAEQTYRAKFFQNTRRNENVGFYTFVKERFSAPERTVRYYLLDSDDETGYVEMAAKYRQYVMEEYGIGPMSNERPALPMVIDFVGADQAPGFLANRYLTGTTTSEAMQIVKTLHGMGVENMAINYLGWQPDGFGAYGDWSSVDRRLGGDGGMKQFIGFAHSLGFPVYLGASYVLNDNGNGFDDKYDGLRNSSGRVVRYRMFRTNEEWTQVSPKVSQQWIEDDLPQYRELGADGIFFYEGIGQFLNTDYNDRHGSDRSESLNVQRSILETVSEQLGGAAADRANMYTLGTIDLIHNLPSDYSYDLHMDKAVPFLQIALHGLIDYSYSYANDRDQYRQQFLRGIEHGALPSFVFTYAPSREMKDASSVSWYSMHYGDWIAQAVEEYQQYNDTLSEVQNRFIVGHREIAAGVYETEYEQGTRIVVNYNTKPYSDGDWTVPPQDFIVLPGGERR